MGFSVAGSGGIIFVALIVTFSALSGAFYSSMENFETEINDSSERKIYRQQTDIEIKSVMYNRTNNQTVIKVKNTGSTVLNATKSDVVLDGEIINSENITFDNEEYEGYHWPPEEDLKIRLNDVDLDFIPTVSERVGNKVTKGITLPGSISSNSNYTYVIEDGDVDDRGNISIYDYKNNLINTISGGILDKATDLSSNYQNLFVIDNQNHVDKFDLEGGGGVEHITNGELTSPKAISVTDENTQDYIYILDDNSHVDRFNLNGSYHDTPVTNLDGVIDIYVTDHIYLVNETSNSVERYSLDGTTHSTLISGGELSDPSNITVSDQNFASPRIYVVDSSSHVDVFDTDGTFIKTIEEEMGSQLGGIDVAGKIFIGNGLNGWFRLNLGPKLKVVLENGIADYERI